MRQSAFASKVLTWQQNLLKESLSNAFWEESHRIQVLHVLTLPSVIFFCWYFKCGEPNLRAKDCNAVLSVIGLSYVELLLTELC